MLCGYHLPWPQGDHPREYGENSSTKTVKWYQAGSSPRIRGESTAHDTNGDAAGIIPANTGRMLIVKKPWHLDKDHPREYGENTLVNSRGSEVDHPREYGENQNPAPFLYRIMGSSPRIRGESTTNYATELQHRIIPANTGRIHWNGPHLAPHRDHPREYGENRV